jgi:hypothetical protein
MELPPIAKLWKDEVQTGSYYGLTLKIINEGARD